MVDHVTDGLPGSLSYVWANTIRGVIGGRIRALGERSGRAELWFCHRPVLVDSEPDARAHRGLYRRAADLAIPLSGVSVAHGVQRPRDLHREVEFCAARQMRRVQVAAVPVGRDGREWTRHAWSKPHLAAERLERDANASGQLGPTRLQLPE